MHKFYNLFHGLLDLAVLACCIAAYPSTLATIKAALAVEIQAGYVFCFSPADEMYCFKNPTSPANADATCYCLPSVYYLALFRWAGVLAVGVIFDFLTKLIPTLAAATMSVDTLGKSKVWQALCTNHWGSLILYFVAPQKYAALSNAQPFTSVARFIIQLVPSGFLLICSCIYLGSYLAFIPVAAISIFLSLSYGCVFIYIAAASPNRASLGGTNGICQCMVSIMRAFGPAVANSLFSLSMEKDYLGGYLVYVVLTGMVFLALALGNHLPRRLWNE